MFHSIGSIQKLAIPQRSYGQGLSVGEDATSLFEILGV